MTVSDPVLFGCASGSLVAALVCAPMATADIVRNWRLMAVSRQRIYLALLVVSAVALVMVPGQMVQVFTGYDLLDGIALHGPAPRYGAGHAALLQPLFDVIGPSQGLVFGVHALIGWCSMVVISTWVSRWLERPSVAVVALLAVVCVPVLLRHHRSEAATVVATLAMFMALLHGLRALQTASKQAQWAAWLTWAYAAHVRPEMVVAGPVLLLAQRHLFGSIAKGARSLTIGSVMAPLVALALVAPQLVHVLFGLSVENSVGDLPMTESWAWLKLPVMVVTHNLMFWPDAFPVGLTLLGVLAWPHCIRHLQPSVRSLARWLPLAIIALLVPSMVDPPEVSLPRLEAPALMLWAAVAAGFASVRWQGASRRWQAALVLVVLVSAGATLPYAFRTSNAEYEDRFLQAAAVELAGKRGLLHVLGSGDEAADKVSRHYPGYLFRRPHTELRVARLGDLPAAGEGQRDDDLADNESRYVLLGVRCYARQRPEGSPPPAAFEHRPCQVARARQDLETLLEVDVPNRGDVHFPWWPANTTLQLRLYRQTRPER